MPTGYTALIENGQVKDAKTFLHLCLRNFGICQHMRDDSLSVTDDYTESITKSYDDTIEHCHRRLNNSRKQLDDYMLIEESERRKMFEEYVSSQIAEVQERVEKFSVKVNDEYNVIIDAIKNWDCSKDFENVKRFALDQIDQTVHYDYDCTYELERIEELKKMTFEEYDLNRIDNLKWSVNYDMEEMNKAIKRKADALDWYARFKEELNKI